MFGLFKKIVTPENQEEKQPEEKQPEDYRDPKAVIDALKPQAPYQLKIKQVSLGLEIALISHNEKRLERRRSKAMARAKAGHSEARRSLLIVELACHRLELAREARATNLARGFLKGKPYSAIENKCREDNDPFWAMDRALEIAKKVGVGDKRVTAQAFERWEQEAKAHFEATKIPPLTAIQRLERYARRLDARGKQLSLTPTDRVRRAIDWKHSGQWGGKA